MKRPITLVLVMLLMPVVGAVAYAHTQHKVTGGVRFDFRVS